MKNRGEKLLKFSGVLFFIEGIIGVIAYGIMTLMLGVESIIEKSEAGAAVTGIAVLYLIASIVSLIAGVMGVKHANDSKSAKKCLIIGIINLVLIYAAGLWSAFGGGATSTHFAYTGLALIIPSMYVSGAYMNQE